MRDKVTKIGVCSICLLCVLFLHTCELVVRYPCTHADTLKFQFVGIAIILSAVEIILSVKRRKVIIAFWLLLGVLLALPMIEDRYNILVPYATWIDRGMPEWGHPTSGGVK